MPAEPVKKRKTSRHFPSRMRASGADYSRHPVESLHRPYDFCVV